jgi:small subunit ribosomal protein S15
MLNKEEKSLIIGKYGKSADDTGSHEVQVALLTKRISQLAGHLTKFPKDKHSRHGLICLLGQRRSFLSYVKRTKDLSSYNSFVASLKEI